MIEQSMEIKHGPCGSECSSCHALLAASRSTLNIDAGKSPAAQICFLRQRHDGATFPVVMVMGGNQMEKKVVVVRSTGCRMDAVYSFTLTSFLAFETFQGDGR